MSQQDLSNFAEVLKEVWEPAYAEFLNNSDRTRAQFDSNSRGVVQGKYIKAAAHIGRNSGFAFLAEGEATPTAGHQSFMDTLINAKKAIGRIKLTSEVIQDSATDTAAVADAMSVEKDGLGKDARREINFLLHAAGNGVIAQCGTTTSSTTVVMAASTTKNVWRYLRDVVAAGGSNDSGLVITVGTVAAPGTVSAGVTVTAVNEGAGTITVSSAISTTSADFIFRKNQGGAVGGVGQKVPSSLLQMIDDTAPLYGADPASFPLWKSEVIDAANAAVTEDIFEEAFDEIDIATGDVFGNGPALIITTHAIRKQLAASMKDRVRYQPVELKGGFNSNMTLQAGGGQVGLIVDRDCRDNTAYLTDPSSITHVVAEDWNFVLQAGTPIQYNQNDDSYNLLLRQRSEYMVKDRRSNARIDNLGPAVVTGDGLE